MKRKPPPGNVRRVVPVSNNFRGVTINKRGHLVQFESEQERKLILLLERDDRVADYVSQPETLHFIDDQGHACRYTPDFQVWRVDGAIELHEVTLAGRRESRASLQQREVAAREICNQRRWHYVVHTDQTLPAGYEYANLDFLSAFRSHVFINPDIEAWWRTQLTDQGHTQLTTILAQGEETSALPTRALLTGLYHLVWHGQVGMDWNQPLISRGSIHRSARVWWARGSMKEVRS
jgi:hypothetical protein